MKVRSVWPLLACLAWGLVCAGGVLALWRYELAPGADAAAPAVWPAASRLPRADDRATLVMLAHPRCACTRASLAELERLMARAGGRLTAQVLFVRPPEVAAAWTDGDLWARAAAIPGVHVERDDGGLEAARFGARTSGDVVVYDPAGRLLFEGGITSARGHEGDNPGRSAILAALAAPPADAAAAPVFGCPLAGPPETCAGGEGACPS